MHKTWEAENPSAGYVAHNWVGASSTSISRHRRGTRRARVALGGSGRPSWRGGLRLGFHLPHLFLVIAAWHTVATLDGRLRAILRVVAHVQTIPSMVLAPAGRRCSAVFRARPSPGPVSPFR